MEYFKRYKEEAEKAIENLSSEYDELLDELTAAKKRIEELEEELEEAKSELSEYR
jgi:peptidoglycan hydrolase CwlO-like protein